MEYPNQWHMTAAFEKSTANRILTVIRILSDGTTVKELTRKANYFRVGSWEITAELNAAKPAGLLIRNKENGTIFSLGDRKLRIDGNDYQQEKGSSLLYDEVDGKWTIQEMQDRAPQLTGAVPTFVDN